eukprot:GHVT01029479.1.p1 GENE.GHVT01029479.1~~GHVT01029479.1.p1  ORF type:complete len:1001 (-),score=298.23 GHVT01029479.1:2566-5568(-)
MSSLFLTFFCFKFKFFQERLKVVFETRDSIVFRMWSCAGRRGVGVSLFCLVCVSALVVPLGQVHLAVCEDDASVDELTRLMGEAGKFGVGDGEEMPFPSDEAMPSGARDDMAAAPPAMPAVAPDFNDEEIAALKKTEESHSFQAEVSRLMDIIINSFYKSRDIFLREMISNAADANEKVRFLALTGGAAAGASEAAPTRTMDPAVLGDTSNLDIKVDFDTNAKTISVTDTGIGMTKQELIDNLGTVAKSGTSNFLEALATGGDVNMIGQFGVGFYAAFLVADKVTVVTRHPEDEQYVWTSSADGSFSVAKDPRGSTLGRGTKITLHLKEDATEFLNEFKLKDLITRYSQFIPFPIYVRVVKTVTEQVPIEEDKSKTGQDKEGKDLDDLEVTDEDESEKEKKTKEVSKQVREWEQVNVEKAIWLRNKDSVTEEEYESFYKSIAKDFTSPLAYTHFSAEGDIDFTSILYVPERAPSDMFENYFKKQHAIKLYVRRVLVAEEFDDMMPKYLNFVKGVVDSDDLPLNVSRDELQQSKILKVISKKLTRKTLELIRKMKKDGEKQLTELKESIESESDTEKKAELKKKLSAESKFDKFYKQFGRNLLLGCYDDDANRSKIAKVLLYRTNQSGEKSISLDEYLERMPSTQSAIYYASGDSIEQLRKLPQLQAFDRKNVEVLFLTHPMDEPCAQKLVEYEGKKLVSIQKADATLDETPEEAELFANMKKVYQPLLDWWRKELTGKIGKVELSKRLVTDPCTVISSQWGYSAHMERLMKSQTFVDRSMVEMMSSQKNLEVNPKHPAIYKLLSIVKENPENEDAKRIAHTLFDAAIFASGFDVPDPAQFSAIIYRAVAKDLEVEEEQQQLVKAHQSGATQTQADQEDEEADEEDQEDQEDAEKQTKPKSEKKDSKHGKEAKAVKLPKGLDDDIEELIKAEAEEKENRRLEKEKKEKEEKEEKEKKEKEKKEKEQEEKEEKKEEEKEKTDKKDDDTEGEEEEKKEEKDEL